MNDNYMSNGHLPNPLTNGLVVDGNYIDGSWELSILVEDLAEEVKVRVTGELTLGGLMHRIVEGIQFQQSWSDHGIWWADRNMWLLHNRTTLDQYGVQSDAKLVFRRMHGSLQVVLPSLIPVVLRVSFSSRVYTVVSDICKQLNIRHPEELSLMFPITHEHMKTNRPVPILRHGNRRANKAENVHSGTATLSKKQLRSMGPFMEANTSPYETLRSHGGTLMRPQSDQSLDGQRDGSFRSDFLTSRSAKSAFAGDWLMRPNNLIQKARLNSGWLDTSRSLMEHGIEPPGVSDSPPTLYLSFKYMTFYDLNVKYDVVRIHQLFEQARFSLLSGVLDCTEDEMIVFAAYQLQAQIQATQHDGFMDHGSVYPTLGPSSTLGGTTLSGGFGLSRDVSHRPFLTMRSSSMSPSIRHPGAHSPLSGTSLIDGNSHWGASECPTSPVEEVDELLAGLEQSCGVAEEPGSATRSIRPTPSVLTGSSFKSDGLDGTDTSEIPSLQDSLRVLKDPGLIKRYKVYWVVIRETSLYLFPNERETTHPVQIYSLRDCSIHPDVAALEHKYILKLNLLIDRGAKSSNGKVSNGTGESINHHVHHQSIREDVCLRFEAPEQYARWSAACRLTSKGKTLASRVAYEREATAILDMLRLQLSTTPIQGASKDISMQCLADLSDFCAERIIRKSRSKQHLRQRIAEARVNLKDLSAGEAKFKYIQAWQRLSGFGRSYFTVQYDRNSASDNIPPTTGGLFSTSSDDLIAISPTGIELVSPKTGDVLRAWNYSEVRSWDVNWEAKTVCLELRGDRVTFQPLCANCKTIAEFIGGYICLNLRTPEGNQEFNERQFLRLTATFD